VKKVLRNHFSLKILSKFKDLFLKNLIGSKKVLPLQSEIKVTVHHAGHLQQLEQWKELISRQLENY
jgi:hypothetical protein